ncbi:hypothetical protein SARC_07130 [Sphaeroforma arctica JP610]|uniref:Uncharacterized protein n=1 Tax=Sphaeroforma arctica JP610 TaxID=667725 RepID=A0A0L0FX24_9EUKA|nr:hypothetical protein SARC_07130 [Sphaeroforma arctica JP610]KNC80508.1 hypothetical protein SARC_07130 [Sphaeroforma arctica JP610]|eukprot:XP_014154410.1 hypothetical protein SARC_07130 [Sphaeroforma arctica JP610]
MVTPHADVFHVNGELLESELQLLETQYQLEYNGTKQLHAANMSWLNVGEKKICWDNLNKIHALERQMLVQQKEAELTRGVQNHSHRLEMQSEINKQRNANLQAIIRVMRKKQLPRDQDTQFRSALHVCPRTVAPHSHVHSMDENKVRFMASEERKRKRLAAEMDEKIRHMNQQSAEQAEAEMSEINEYNELRKEKMHLKNQSADEASKRKYDKQVEEFHQNFETHLEQLTARQKLEMESLAHKYVQLRDQVIEKWSNAAAGGSSVSLNNSSQSGLNLVSSIRSSSSMSSHRSFRT